MPPVLGARIEVAVPPAVVMVSPATKLVVSAGANQTLLPASPELEIVTAAAPFLVAAPENTVLWLVGPVKLNAALAAASVVATLPHVSLAKPTCISKVSSVAPPNPEVASKDASLAVANTIVKVVLVVTLAEVISVKVKLTLPVVLSSPLMSHVSLLQSSRALMSVEADSKRELSSKVL